MMMPPSKEALVDIITRRPDGPTALNHRVRVETHAKARDRCR
ncbi:MAG: hypothetical protein AAGH88_00445 [Planctomycetota bacterium]